MTNDVTDDDTDWLVVWRCFVVHLKNKLWLSIFSVCGIWLVMISFDVLISEVTVTVVRK